MSDFNPNPPPMPPVLTAAAATAAASPAGSRPLGEDPQDREAIPGPLAAIESMLRHPRRVLYQLRQPRSGNLIFALFLIAVVCSLVYGVVVGTFSAGTQLWAAPVKIGAGLVISALICLPSLYIFSCLSGSQARLIEVIGLIAGLLALMTVLLIGFAPVAWVFSQSTDSLAAMGALHLAFWVIATYFGLRFLCAGFAQLSGKAGGLRVWITIFLLVMVQMTTALRPIVGTADTLLPGEKKFFVKHWLEQLEKPSATRPATPR
jgi:hypothetical protein